MANWHEVIGGCATVTQHIFSYSIATYCSHSLGTLIERSLALHHCCHKRPTSFRCWMWDGWCSRVLDNFRIKGTIVHVRHRGLSVPVQGRRQPSSGFDHPKGIRRWVWACPSCLPCWPTTNTTYDTSPQSVYSDLFMWPVPQRHRRESCTLTD